MTEILKSLRSVRIGKFAVFDFATALGGMYFLAPYIHLDQKRALWLTVPVGVVTHHLLGINTPLNQMVLGDNPNRAAQLVVSLLLIQGICAP